VLIARYLMTKFNDLVLELLKVMGSEILKLGDGHFKDLTISCYSKFKFN